jgi:hypothetical protein
VLAGLSSVWVMPGTRFSRDISRSLLEEVNSVWEVVATSSQLDPTRPVYAEVWRKLPAGRQGPILSLTFPEYAGWGWQLPDAATLLATLTYLEHTLGTSVSYSPEQLALDLLKGQDIEAKPSWTCPPTIDCAAAARYSRFGSPVSLAGVPTAIKITSLAATAPPSSVVNSIPPRRAASPSNSSRCGS